VIGFRATEAFAYLPYWPSYCVSCISYSSDAHDYASLIKRYNADYSIIDDIYILIIKLPSILRSLITDERTDKSVSR